jgi:DNA-directed RNA polymerase II subunit RPB2
MNTIQEIVEEVGRIVIKPERQYKPQDKRTYGMAAMILDGQTYELKFEQLHVYQKPTYRDSNRVTHNIRPNEARLRNLTYESELFMDVRCKIYNHDPDTNEERILKNELMEKIPIGKIPIMVRSKYCALNGLNHRGMETTN